MKQHPIRLRWISLDFAQRKNLRWDCTGLCAVPHRGCSAYHKLRVSGICRMVSQFCPAYGYEADIRKKPSYGGLNLSGLFAQTTAFLS